MSDGNLDETEIELKKRLGIESWRNLSKDKFMMFISDLPNMNKEVVLEIIGRFPDFVNLVMSAFVHVQEQATQGLRFNHESQKKVHQAFKQYRRILSRELDREDLTSEDRFRILGLLKDAIDAEALKDTDNKEFLKQIIGMVAAAAALVASIAFAALGGKTSIGRGSA